MRWARWASQLLLALVLLWFVGRALAGHLAGFQAADLQVALQPAWIGLAGLLALATFAVLIQSWRLTLGGWGQVLSGRALAETWFVANLGRYIPGKVWSVAGMIVLATRQGVAAWAASASAVVVQALGIATAIAVVAATLPMAESGLRLAGAGLLAGGVVLALSSSRVTTWAAGRVPALAELRPIPTRALVGAASFATIGWIGYGASFWALSRGLGQGTILPPTLAVGAFALAYTAGLLALFAPGGLVVREGVLVAILAPALGPGPALALSLGSRVLLTGAELVAAAPFLYSWLRSGQRAPG